MRRESTLTVDGDPRFWAYALPGTILRICGEHVVVVRADPATNSIVVSRLTRLGALVVRLRRFTRRLWWRTRDFAQLFRLTETIARKRGAQ